MGLDPHVEGPRGLNVGPFYESFLVGNPLAPDLTEDLRRILDVHVMRFGASTSRRPRRDLIRGSRHLAGIACYFLELIEAAWAEGIRVYKPQSSFFEALAPAGEYLLSLVAMAVHEAAEKSGEPYFLILDAKRGDIMTTQERYYTYLTGLEDEIYPGMTGCYDFDTMTVTTWMGEDVLTPGLPWFRAGKGAIVVTRSSNPSGTTFQDLDAHPNIGLTLSEEQKPFRFSPERYEAVEEGMLERRTPTVHELMLAETAAFSLKHNLDEEGVSSIFSVMGSTVQMTPAFRKLRPGGIALVPGFGAQGGSFAKVMPLLVKEGPLAGHIGILASSREHNYPWMKRFGGSGDPRTLRGDLGRAIAAFRQLERDAYTEAYDVSYPF